jgi:hypothetical protein
VRDVTNRGGEFQNGTRGLKAGSEQGTGYAALEGPLFHGTIEGVARREEIPGSGGRRSRFGSVKISRARAA